MSLLIIMLKQDRISKTKKSRPSTKSTIHMSAGDKLKKSSMKYVTQENNKNLDQF